MPEKTNALEMARVKLDFVRDECNRVVEIIRCCLSCEPITESTTRELRARIEIINQSFHEFSGIVAVAEMMQKLSDADKLRLVSEGDYS